MRYPRESSTKRGYDRHWSRVRKVVLAEEPLCRFCKQSGKLTPATVVDHIIKIQDAPHLRLDRRNLQPLCKRCHDSRKAAIESSGFDGEVGEDGWPVDPNHPANKLG